ncbi:MAG: hypothetical protein IPO70_14845 [Bacteroidetes bacterium]|nr:hypothetical protein [Bacteroidota bacterium]
MKIYKSIVTILFCVYNLTAKSQIDISFPNLKKISVDTSFVKVIFGYDSKTTRLIRKKCFELPKTDQWHCDNEDAGEIIEIVGKYANDKISDSIQIVYDPGLSVDPEFIITKTNGKIMGRVAALEFYINNNGVIYSAGHINNMFNKRRKFQLYIDTLIEIQQPFYYVGLKTKTASPLTLYHSKSGNEIIAQLPKDYEIEVLLCDTEKNKSQKFYLVKTDFGLVGWLRLTDDSTFETPAKGLFYKGD